MMSHQAHPTKLTPACLSKMRAEGTKISMITAYDYTSARLLDQAGIDVLLVGDSLGMVVQGKENTLPVTLEEMIYHTEMVARGAGRAIVIADLPFPVVQLGVESALNASVQIIKRTRATGVKVEGGENRVAIIRALLEAGIPVRQIEEGRNVPMYITNIPCRPAGVFHGNVVVSMRPMTPEQAIRASIVTSAMPRVHGKPLHLGDPSAIGIKDIGKPDFGDSVTIRPEEIPVFWPCGVTPQAVLMAAKPPFAITHAPGHMFISDVKNTALKY